MQHADVVHQMATGANGVQVASARDATKRPSTGCQSIHGWSGLSLHGRGQYTNFINSLPYQLSHH